MLKFVVSEDRNWLSLIDYEEEFERKQLEKYIIIIFIH